MEQIINNLTILKDADTVPYLAFKPLLDIPWLRHGFSTRLGGVSEGIYESMNLGLDRGDDNDKVIENYSRICNGIGIDYRELVFTDQVHKTNIRIATTADKGKGILYERDYDEIDGHMTDTAKLPLLVFGADCVPLFFVDTEHKAIGLAHSGWKGTANKIGRVMADKMHDVYNTDYSKLIVVIGPSICKQCYEVSKDVYNAFSEKYNVEELKECFEYKGNDKYMLDLWEANNKALISAGVRSENIHKCGVCTMCRKDLMFSHRRDGLNRGSMAGFLMIADE